MPHDISKKYKVVTLGCRTNQYESQAYQKQLKALGYHIAGEDENADLCIVNTCTVTESADSSSRHQIRKLIKENPGAKVVVTGCLAERATKALLQIEGVSQVVPNAEKERLIQWIFPDLDQYPEFSIENFEAHTRAFVKVQDGCNSFCSYCIIPYVRGKSRSRSTSEIIREIKQLVENGYREVVITGINVGDFDGGDGENPQSLADLIREVDSVEGLERIRVSSIDPDEVDADFMDAIMNGKKTCNSLHLVLQSGSNIILKRMRRKYTRQCFMETVGRLREVDPDFTFTTDVIVGFPGETERDLQDTLEVIREVGFAKVHMFPYSDREGTWAQKRYHDKVPPSVMKERKHRLLKAAEESGFALRQRYLGKVLDVLTESVDEKNPGKIAGHTEHFLKVSIDKGSLRPNEMVKVHLLENTPEGLVGKIQEESFV